MRVYNNGCFYTVAYNEQDARDFSESWPCSTVEGKGAFQFDKSNGDLVDATGTAAQNDGPDWLAFSQDCQSYGETRLKIE